MTDFNIDYMRADYNGVADQLADSHELLIEELLRIVRPDMSEGLRCKLASILRPHFRNDLIWMGQLGGELMTSATSPVQQLQVQGVLAESEEYDKFIFDSIQEVLRAE